MTKSQLVFIEESSQTFPRETFRLTVKLYIQLVQLLLLLPLLLLPLLLLLLLQWNSSFKTTPRSKQE